MLLGVLRFTPVLLEQMALLHHARPLMHLSSIITGGDTGGLTMSFTDWTSAYPTACRPTMAANVVSTSQPFGAQAGLAHAPRC